MKNKHIITYITDVDDDKISTLCINLKIINNLLYYIK